MRSDAAAVVGGGIEFETYNTGLWLAVQTTGDDGYAGINLAASEYFNIQAGGTLHLRSDDATGWGIELITPSAAGGSQGIMLASEGAIRLEADEIAIDLDSHANAVFSLNANIIGITATTDANPGQIQLVADAALSISSFGGDATVTADSTGIQLTTAGIWGPQIRLVSIDDILLQVGVGADLTIYNLPTVPTQPGAVYDSGGFLKITP